MHSIAIGSILLKLYSIFCIRGRNPVQLQHQIAVLSFKVGALAACTAVYGRLSGFCKAKAHAHSHCRCGPASCAAGTSSAPAGHHATCIPNSHPTCSHSVSHHAAPCKCQPRSPAARHTCPSSEFTTQSCPVSTPALASLQPSTPKPCTITANTPATVQPSTKPCCQFQSYLSYRASE